MASSAKIRQGLKVNLPALQPGELGFCTDKREVYIGSTVGNGLVSGPSTIFSGTAGTDTPLITTALTTLVTPSATTASIIMDGTTNKISDNGSGKIRITIPNNNFVSGDCIMIEDGPNGGVVPTPIVKLTTGSQTAVVLPYIKSKAFYFVMNVGVGANLGTFEISRTQALVAETYGGATPTGTNGWIITKQFTSTNFGITDLDFNNDGGEWDIDIIGMLIPSTQTTVKAFTVKPNGIAGTVYFLEANNGVTSSITNKDLVSKKYHVINYKLKLIRINTTMISYEVTISTAGIANDDAGALDFTGANAARTVMFGFVSDATLTNITNLQFYMPGVFMVNGTTLTIRRG